MGWFASTLEAIREQTRHDPIECPRGWGQVAFVGSAWVIPPLFGIERKCPIGGVNECRECKYGKNPSAFRLAEQLDELARLQSEGLLSSAECASRRKVLVDFVSEPDRGRRKQHTAAWIMGPLGALVSIAGIALAITVDPGFWSIAGIGFVLLALAVSFWVLSRSPGPQAGTGTGA